MRRCCAAVLVAIVACWCVRAGASTTGSLRGRVTDAATNLPIAGARVTADSPSQIATAVTDVSGTFSFLALAPDSYTLRVEKSGYEPASQAGAVVFADQAASFVIALSPALRTIARVGTRSSSSLVRSGTTSDVYSVNAAGQKAAQSVAGSGSLNQAYGAIASVPGVSVPSGQQGWYQSVYIRGGDTDQVAYEFDGVPVVRQSDYAPIVTLSALGQQEVQVYTGGTPATSNSSGLAGYINQVIKTGTYPGYADVDASIGTPQFYHDLSVETGGATPDRLFSYYVGLAGANQSYRYIDQFNGAGDPRYFYPLQIQTGNSLYQVVDGSCLLKGAYAPCKNDPNFGTLYSPGNSYFQATGFDRENVMNFHVGIPHRSGGGRDDIQLLYVTGNIATQFYSSYNDVYSGQVFPGGVPYYDSTYYDGALGAPPNPSQLVVGRFPSSPAGRIYNNITVDGSTTTPSLIGLNQRDGNGNNFSVEKLQYQRNFNSSSYLRVLAYGEYSSWLINGPNATQFVFSADPAEYDVLANIYGGNAIYSNQLSSKNLLTASLAYTLQTLSDYNAQYASVGGNPVPPTGLGTLVSSYVGANGTCFNYKTGAPWSCFDAGSQGGALSGPYSGCPSAANYPAICLTPGNAPAGTPAARAGAHWIMTEDGRSAQIDTVDPYFSSLALTDVWTPDDKLLVNVGARVDDFKYTFSNTAAGYPARAFWFAAFNREYCGAPAQDPVWRWNGSSFTACPAGFQPMTAPGVGLYNSGVPSSISQWEFQPRLGLTYTLSTNTVLRASAGKYARAAETGSGSLEQNAVQQDLPDQLLPFYRLGYHTPYHPGVPDTSNNFDVSWEQHIKGTQLSFKLSPFYRATSNQVQFFATDPATGIGTGLNVGTQHSSGVELSVQDGDFTKDGLSWQLSYTYTNSTIKYAPISNGVSVLDSFNAAIEQYNSYTRGCAGAASKSQLCGSGAYAGNAQPVFNNGKGVVVDNPYYNGSPQPLVDRNGWFTTYDFIPTAFNNANGFAVPNVATLIVNYKHKKFSITPNLTYTSGSFYGSPLSWGGYVPQSCTQSPKLTPAAPGASCSGSYTTPTGATLNSGVIFTPDPYTGRFDGLGSLQQPWQLSVNLQANYDVSSNASVSVVASNLFNACFQRGYAWDDSNFCMYSNLPSNILAPAGNFLRTPPVQLKYPYGPWSNQNEVGYTAVKQPFQFTAALHLRI
ncbi:MAG: TonB-dependent receptor [Candidatus Eremiobacteraeota bacterium]|nr:TonB-dependent receptor [Candidatus Eremiobacteraeota bacterium]